jgi:hypothetical protein
MAHDWHLSSEVIGDTIYAVAICRKCGATRSGFVGRGKTEKQFSV